MHRQPDDTDDMPIIPRCHNTLMDWEYGDSDDTGVSEEWFICKHCGCVKDENGNVIKQD